MTTTYAWLIERGQSEGEPQTVYWTGDVVDPGLTQWTRDANEAWRFASRDEAEQAIEDARSSIGLDGRAVEHAWFT